MIQLIGCLLAVAAILWLSVTLLVCLEDKDDD